MGCLWSATTGGNGSAAAKSCVKSDEDTDSKDALPNPMKWNLAWSQKLWAKKAEVDAMHESILEDIRMRVAVIAKEKGLTMVWTNTMGTDKDVVDITNDVLATYQ